MATHLSPYLTERTHTWTEWKAAHTSHMGLLQYDALPDHYLIWFYDGPEVHTCQIWRETVPQDIVDGGYTQEENDSDKADFEGNYQANGNQPLDYRTSEGKLLFQLNPDTSFDIPAVSVLNTPDASTGLVKSWQLTVAANTTEYYDIEVADDLVGPTGRCFLVGGEYRCRTEAVEGSALHMAIVDRDDLLGLFTPYGMHRTKLEGLTSIVGTIHVGDHVVGSTSSKNSQVLAVGSDYCEISFSDGAFTDGESLVFYGSDGVTPTGASAVLGTWNEGDVLELQRNVRDEWVEGYDQRTIQPGGSKELPAGLYLRVIVFNASPTDAFRVKVSFVMATM